MVSSHNPPSSKVPGSNCHTYKGPCNMDLHTPWFNFYLSSSTILYTSMSNSNPYPSSINSPTSGCSPFYHFFCSILHIIHFCNNYLLHLVIYNLTHILGRIRPHFDLYLVIQGHSLSLYYTVSCTGFLFRLVQFFKISILIHLLTGRVWPVPWPYPCYSRSIYLTLTFTLSFKVSHFHCILHSPVLVFCSI